MNYTIFQSRLIELINAIRSYGHRLLEGLTSKELVWIPEGTRGRSIKSYFRHIINAELFWLKNLGYNETPDYLANESSFDELLASYDSLKSYLIKEVQTAPEEELIPNATEGERTLAWMIWRTSLHAIHHYAQISYIRYAIENPPNSKLVESSWGKTVDKLVTLGSFEGSF